MAIPSGYHSRFKAAIANVTIDADGLVSLWTDLGSNEMDLAPGGAALPYFSTDAWGRPCVRFQGTSATEDLDVRPRLTNANIPWQGNYSTTAVVASYEYPTWGVSGNAFLRALANFGYWAQTGEDFNLWSTQSGAVTSQKWESSPHVILYRGAVDADGSGFIIHNTWIPFANGGAAANGFSVGMNRYQGNVHEIIQYKPPISLAECWNLYNQLEADWGLVSSQKALFIEGDSIISSMAGSTGSTRRRGVDDRLFWQGGSSYRAINMAVPGSQMSHLTSRLTLAQTKIGQWVTANLTPIVAYIHAGTNDLVAGSRTPAQVYGDLQTYVAAIKGYGVTHAVVATILPRTDLSDETRGTLNALIRAGVAAGSWDAVADYDADAIAIAAAGAFDNVLLYNTADEIHPTDAGTQILADAVSRAIGKITGPAVGNVLIGTDIGNETVGTLTMPRRYHALVR